jgi:hypothetical protein
MNVSKKVRCLAIVTGFLTGIAGALVFGILFALYPAFLVFGAVIEPRFPRLGRGLICFGALWLTFWVSDFTYLAVREGRPSDHWLIAVTLMSFLLVAGCDLAIVIEELRLRRIQVRADH